MKSRVIATILASTNPKCPGIRWLKRQVKAGKSLREMYVKCPYPLWLGSMLLTLLNWDHRELITQAFDAGENPAAFRRVLPWAVVEKWLRKKYGRAK